MFVPSEIHYGLQVVRGACSTAFCVQLLGCRYTEVAVVEELFCVQTLNSFGMGPVYLAVIAQLALLQGWPLRGVPCTIYSCSI